jgi:hypothetical protein
VLSSEVLFHLWEYEMKSEGAKSGVYGGCRRISQPEEFQEIYSLQLRQQRKRRTLSPVDSNPGLT